jgi:hypothetical protein
MTTMDQMLDNLMLVRPRYPAPRYLPPPQLLAAYETLAAKGYTAAALRVAMLRRSTAAPQETTP